MTYLFHVVSGITLLTYDYLLTIGDEVCVLKFQDSWGTCCNSLIGTNNMEITMEFWEGLVPICEIISSDL